MDMDGDRTGAAGSRGEPPGEPDEFDSLVLDEAFIAAGIPEASLPQYRRPPAPPVPPLGAGLPPSRSGSSPLDPTGVTVPSFRRRPLRSVGALLMVVVLLVTGVVVTGFLHLQGGANGAAGTAGATDFDAGVEAARAQLAGLSTNTPEGTCFDVQAASTSPSIGVEPCAQQHEYELVSVVQATGDSATYPAASYWAGTIDDQCAHDLQALTGRTPTNWPAGLHVGSLPPSQGSWAGGDRTVYCIAYSVPSVTGSLRQHNTAAPTA